MSGTGQQDLPARLREDEPLFNAWIATGHPEYLREIRAAGFESATLDLQHGLMGPDAMYNALAACAAIGLTPLVRIPVGDMSLASRALDGGACGIIAPMINTADDARELVAATRFPPLGCRSWGPVHAYGLNANRTDYLHRANDLTVIFAMIETEEALHAIESILAVPGIDGVFIGPNDLSVTLTRGRQIDVRSQVVQAALEKIFLAARKHHKIPAIFANTPELAGDYARRGFHMISMGSELGFLRSGARAALDIATGSTS